MKSVMKHRFSNVPRVEIPRSTFNRSHGYKTTFDAGYLVPILVDEALPGDTFKVDLTGFARLSTPIYPIMDNMFMETFFFAVPYRLLWDNWVKMMGERRNPDDSIDFTVPQTVINNKANGTLADYFGIPTKVAADLSVSALPFRAYNRIWNEWFRDENLQERAMDITGDGPDSQIRYFLRRRGKRHDYFTSALPWLQKGDAMSISFADAPVYGDGVFDDTKPVSILDDKVEDGGESKKLRIVVSGGAQEHLLASSIAGGVDDVGLYADLSEHIVTVNELRQAVQVQRLLEKDARSGTRYIEIIKSHFGVTSPDARLQRPEYLGGGRSPVVITPIARTDSSPGKLGAMGIAGFKGHGFVKSFTEHCVIIGLVNVRADLTYQEGLDRMWSRESRYDFYWPSLAHLGEQAILNKEIYVDASDIGDGTSEEVFGYQERFAEYRYKASRITGLFRSNDEASLDAWHLGIEFGDTPTLDDIFIEDNPPIDRVIATPAEPHFIFDSYINMICTRPMPIYSIPGMMDHF